jgi:hypothetical protein
VARAELAGGQPHLAAGVAAAHEGGVLIKLKSYHLHYNKCVLRLSIVLVVITYPM